MSDRVIPFPTASTIALRAANREAYYIRVASLRVIRMRLSIGSRQAAEQGASLAVSTALVLAAPLY